MTQVELLKEAVEIADGQTLKLGTTEHVKALMDLLRKVADRWPAGKARPYLDSDLLDEESLGTGRDAEAADVAEIIRTALEGR